MDLFCDIDFVRAFTDSHPEELGNSLNCNLHGLEGDLEGLTSFRALRVGFNYIPAVFELTGTQCKRRDVVLDSNLDIIKRIVFFVRAKLILAIDIDLCDLKLELLLNLDLREESGASLFCEDCIDILSIIVLNALIRAEINNFKYLQAHVKVINPIDLKL